jgi:PAS domain S-box-containing protein
MAARFLGQSATHRDSGQVDKKGAGEIAGEASENFRPQDRDSLTRLYEVLLSTTDDFAYIFDPQGRFLYANTRLLKVWAKTLDQVVGKTCYELDYPTWHADMHMREIKEIVRTKLPIRNEVPFTGASGIFGIYDYIFQPVLDAAGNVEVIVGTTRDVTDRKKSEEKLETALKEKSISEQRYRFLADSLPQIAWTAQPDGNLDYYNQRWFDYAGTTFEEMQKVGWTHYVHPDDLPHAGQVWQKSLETGCDYEVEFRLIRASDQTYRWHLVRAFPMRDEKGTILQWIGTCTDIDDQRQLTQELAETAAKFASFFDQSLSFAGILAPDGTLLEANSLSLEGCGYRAEDVIGKPFWECGWWRGSQELQKKIRTGVQLAAEGIPYAETLNYYLADGTERVVDFSLNPIRDVEGNVIFVTPSGIDVTERVRNHAQTEFLVQLTQKLSAAASSTELNQIATREIGEFLHAHRCYFFDAYPDINHARVLTDWCREAEPSLVGVYTLSEFGAAEWWAAVRVGPVSVDDIRANELTKNFLPNYDALKIAAYSLSPFIHEGQWKACISVTSDKPRVWSAEEKALLENVVARVWPLLERAQIEEKLERLVGERTASLREAVTQMEEFSYSVSHDLRAPLRAMQGYAAALLEDYRGKVIDAEGEEYLQRIVSAGQRMDRLTRDVLVYSRIPRTSLQLQAVALDKLVSDIVQQYRQEKTNPAEIIIQTPLLPVIGNESFLAQAISNLVDNAVKFMPPGRIARVKVSTEPHQDKVRFWVEDNGIGIMPEHQKRIWGMFERVHPQTKYDGTGIGLAIVRKTIERMNGTMGVESDGTTGSRFWIQLPGI